MQNVEIQNKMKITNLEKYGTENVSSNKEIQSKKKQTCQTNYGVDNPSQSPEIKLKKKATSMTNFGVEHHLKDYDMLQKLFKSQHKVHRYKETILYYQGTYELFFLKLIEERRLLNEVSNGKSYEYNFESTKHTYHTDFHFHDTNIEIKSGWTYNKNGTDKKLEELNETKWKAVNDAGDAIIILKSKTEIQTFVNSLK